MASNFHDKPSLRASHTVAAIKKRLASGPKHSYLRDFIYGAVDGTVTTFAIVAGVGGAQLASVVVIILGFCNLIADGFSMAVSNFLGTRAEQELRLQAMKEEERHIALIPEGEREEVRQIFAAKGFSGHDLERIVEVVTSDARVWVDTMMKEELGFAGETVSPLRAGLVTFIAFVIVGVFPLISFVIALSVPGAVASPFAWSIVITAFAFFIVGALKGRFVGKPWYWSGIETLLIGGSASLLAFLIGLVLRGLAGAAT